MTGGGVGGLRDEIELGVAGVDHLRGFDLRADVSSSHRNRRGGVGIRHDGGEDGRLALEVRPGVFCFADGGEVAGEGGARGCGVGAAGGAEGAGEGGAAGLGGPGADGLGAGLVAAAEQAAGEGRAHAEVEVGLAAGQGGVLQAARAVGLGGGGTALDGPGGA